MCACVIFFLILFWFYTFFCFYFGVWSQFYCFFFSLFSIYARNVSHGYFMINRMKEKKRSLMPACVVSGSNQKLFFKCVNHARRQDWRAFCVCQQRHNTVLVSDSKTLAQLQNLGIGMACCWCCCSAAAQCSCFEIAFLPLVRMLTLCYVWVSYCISFCSAKREPGGLSSPMWWSIVSTNIVATFTNNP